MGNVSSHTYTYAGKRSFACNCEENNGKCGLAPPNNRFERTHGTSPFAAQPNVRCTKHIIAHSQTIRSSLLLLFLSVHNKPYTNWEIYHERLAFSCYRNSWRSNRNIRIKI